MNRRVCPGIVATALRALLALAAALGACPARSSAPVHFAGGSAYEAGSFEDQIDRIERDAFDAPDAADKALARHLAAIPVSVTPPLRLQLHAQATVDALAGRAGAALAQAQRLRDLGSADPVASAAGDLAEAEVDDVRGQADRAGDMGSRALAALAVRCEIDAGEGGANRLPLPATCDYRLAWRALQLVALSERRRGMVAVATRHTRAGLQLAERARDPWRQAYSMGELGFLSAREGRQDESLQLLRQAQRIARQQGDAVLQARLAGMEAGAAEARNDRDDVREATERGLVLAERANSPRLEAKMLSNLADVRVKAGQPALALQAADRALPLVRAHHDAHAEGVLLQNRTLALIGLRRVAEAHADMGRVLALWQAAGATDYLLSALREFGEALADVGDTAGALELYHRERKLDEEIKALNRKTSLESLQARNDVQRKERDIELLGRDNALKAEALGNQTLTQRLWLLLALVVGLSTALAALLYGRVRATNRKLIASQAQLRVQSERDPLTNLANRRHFQAVMQQRSAADGFDGALLLVDIDHFKHVNDGHGHAAGDEVLVEVARRLESAVRGDDLVVRWGGEEFLVLTRGVDAGGVEALAARVLRSVGEMPVALRESPASGASGPASLRVTASIGYAHFPLPPQRVNVPWEQAANLTDMALYTAKSQGRNRAVGLVAIETSGREGLRDIEADFERAWRESRVELRITTGPVEA